MAYKKPVQGRAYPHLYNVTMTVGSRKALYKRENATLYTASYAPNRRDDVMLVQYLLKRVNQGWILQGVPPTGAENLKIDGIHGPKTQKAIEDFQLELARGGRCIATDGCVDSEVGYDQYSDISKTGYTISWLNSTFWRQNPALASDITKDPECPPELKQSVAAGDGSV